MPRHSMTLSRHQDELLQTPGSTSAVSSLLQLSPGLVLSSRYLPLHPLTLLGRPILRACFFLRFEVQKWAPSLSYCFAPIPCLKALETCLQACPDAFCSNFHGLATLEFKTAFAEFHSKKNLYQVTQVEGSDESTVGGNQSWHETAQVWNDSWNESWD